jgi:hypothetical protein
MNWWTVIATCVAAIGGPAVVFKVFGDRLLERQKAQYSKQMAEVAHQRSLLLLETQNAFSMGATSHMATVAFDKHIGFCEEYVEAASKVLYTLIQEETKGKPLDPREFFGIRQKWALWLTPEIETKLDRFEHGITKIGVEAPGYEPGGVLGLSESTIKTVIADLREVLGTEGLTALRNELVVRSLKKPPHGSS